jgi:hypothetical protein
MESGGGHGPEAFTSKEVVPQNLIGLAIVIGLRFRSGVDAYIDVLDAQRTLEWHAAPLANPHWRLCPLART